jgi:hypothetical protein
VVEAAADRGIATSIGRFREHQGAPFAAFTGDFFQKLADAAGNGSDTGPHAQILRSLATFGSTDAEGPTTSEAQRIMAVHEGFARLIRRNAFVLLVDDMQWADAGSREWLLSLVRQCKQPVRTRRLTERRTP